VWLFWPGVAKDIIIAGVSGAASEQITLY